MVNDEFQLIMVVVETGCASSILEAAREAGSEGGTIFHGRGVGVHEHKMFFGTPIEPEKEMLMLLIRKTYTEKILEAVVAKGELNKPGKGIAFVLDVQMVAGICHMGEAFPKVP